MPWWTLIEFKTVGASPADVELFHSGGPSANSVFQDGALVWCAEGNNVPRKYTSSYNYNMT